MEVRRYESDLICSNMYVIVEDGHALVIDPWRNIAPAEGVIIDKIILTHEHYDHISGVNLWKEKFGSKVLCSKACALNIQDPKKNMARLFDIFCELQTWVKIDTKPDVDENYTCFTDETFEKKLGFEWKGHFVKLVEIPGHSLGSIAIRVDDSLFSGDSLLEHNEIELRLPGGSRKLWQTIGKGNLISMLDKTEYIYPGHFESFKI